MRWARLVLAVLLVVGWTSAAAAECAWVLWRHSLIAVGIAKSVMWSIEEAYMNRDTCEGGKQKPWDRQMKILREIEATVLEQQPPNKVVTKNRGGGESHIRFLCLPDTIDPREKK